MPVSISLLALSLLLAQTATGHAQQIATESHAAPESQQSSQKSDGEDILVDWIHANDFSMIGLQPGTYEYHVICGFRRGFAYLESQGIRLKYATGGPLTAQRLKPHKLLFINLVSAERLPFLVSEIDAIRSYVAQGGSLFVVTDHTNCYFHAHRLMPLFTELEIRSYTDTACEHPPRTLGDGHGWISITRFKRHPVTADVSCMAMQTGGCVDPQYSVAMTTENSWADSWDVGIYGEDTALGCYGDFAQDSDERSGPLGVLLAKEHGRGRIVVIADQNMFSDTFINYADNYRVWMNIAAWLLRDDGLREHEKYEGWQKPMIALFDQYERAAFGSDEDDEYYHAMSFLNRHHWTFANDRPFTKANLIVLAENDRECTEAQLSRFTEHLRSGKNILVLGSPKKFSLEAQGIVQQVTKRLPVETPRVIDHPDKLIVDYPSFGSIHVMKGEARFNNTSIPPPTVSPTPEEQSRCDALLKSVRDAISE